MASENKTRCEPTAKATPSASAASARLRLIAASSAPTPPVIEEISNGNDNALPMNLAEGSTSEKLSSGRAR